MSYQEFAQRMQVVWQQAERSHATTALHYQRLVEILKAHPNDPQGAEMALWAEYEQTQEVFFQRKAWDVKREC